jgi:tRNA dimethylallyltransferase
MDMGMIFSDVKSNFSIETLPLKKPTLPRSKKKKVIVISGPTSVGKTSLSLRIAHAIGGEIISADSMQVYRSMDIGTAKATKQQREEIPHHLIDCRDLSQSFNIVDFYNEAIKAIHEIHLRDHVPIVVGGTGFYIHALLYGPPQGPPSVPEIRSRLEDEMDEHGAPHLYEKLKELDPDYAMSITQNDKQKIIRALEIIALTQQKVSFFGKTTPEKVEELDFRCWFVHLPKEQLYPRIEKRCDEMLEAGFLDEVKALIEKGLEKNTSASQAIGYRQALRYLHSKQTEEDYKEFVESFKQASRRYAKRQFTWFRKEPFFRWLNLAELTPDRAAEMIIQDIELNF